MAARMGIFHTEKGDNMTYIPDCRTDRYYNEKYLDAQDREFVRGYDWCTQEEVDNYFFNMDMYEGDFDIDGEDINLCRFLTNHPKIMGALKKSLLHYIEMGRDELITSMINGMGEEEYEKAKAAADAGKSEA